MLRPFSVTARSRAQHAAPLRAFLPASAPQSDSFCIRSRPMMPDTRESRVWHRLLPWLAVALLYTAATLIYFWPLPRLFGTHLGPDLGDPLFNLWVLKWGA